MPAQDIETPFEVEDPKQTFSDAAFEIAAAKQELGALGVDFFELPKASPKAEKTKTACMQVIAYLLHEPLLLQSVHKTACLPGKTLMQELGVNSKVLERHRKYILAGLVILGGDYPTLQGYRPCWCPAKGMAGKRQGAAELVAAIILRSPHFSCFPLVLIVGNRNMEGFRMKRTKRIITLLLAALMLLSALPTASASDMFENSDFILMLNQAAGDRKILAQQLNISPNQLSYVTHSGEGEGLLFYGDVILPFVDHFPSDLELYRYLTTKPSEVAKYKETA